MKKIEIVVAHSLTLFLLSFIELRVHAILFFCVIDHAHVVERRWVVVVCYRMLSFLYSCFFFS